MREKGWVDEKEKMRHGQDRVVFHGSLVRAQQLNQPGAR